MMLADAPAIIAPHTANDDIDTIEVVGTRRDQVQKIDRRTYVVKDTPHAAQQDSVELLRALPAVTVGPNDQIMLLGSSTVTIQVDGQPAPYRNIAQFLGSLHGSDIERIEIITNPSAQYAAGGTGGIINFILRRKHTDGLSGTTNAEARSIGYAQASATIKYKKENTTYEVQAQGAGGRTARFTTLERRSVQTDSSAQPTIYINSGDGTSPFESASLSAKVTHALSDATSISAQAIAGIYDSRSSVDDDFIGLTPDFASFAERQRTEESANYVVGNLAVNHKGAKDGETLDASLRVFTNPQVRTAASFVTDRGEDFSTNQDVRDVFADGKIDWVHPIGSDRILTTGAELTTDDLHQTYSLMENGTAALSGFAASDRFRAQTSTMAAYATYQLSLDEWKVMPGIRIERYSQTVSSPGLPSTRVTRTNAFPTFHVERPIGKELDLTLSYSRHVDRPDPGDLRPYPVLKLIDTIAQGNPNLHDQSTDAFEINLHYHLKRLDAGVIVYDRETNQTFGNLYSVNEQGLVAITPINAGHKSDRGAEVDISTPLWRRTKVSGSLNLFDSRTPADFAFGGGTIETFRYSGNASIEWDGPDRGERPGDSAQLLANYQSPRRDFDTRYSSFTKLSLSYTHAFSKRLSLTATADSLFPTKRRSTTIAPLIEDASFQRTDRVFILKLLKTFGGK